MFMFLFLEMKIVDDVSAVLSYLIVISPNLYPLGGISNTTSLVVFRFVVSELFPFG